MTSKILELFGQRIPTKPYHTDNLASGLKIAHRSIASKSRYIQPNGPTHKYFLVFDVDREGAAIDWTDRHVPSPNLTAMNRENGHAHLFFCMETPLRTASDGSRKALKYAAAIENAIRHALDADPAYSGLICKNPLNPDWQVTVWQQELYTLDWLADCVDMTAANAPVIEQDYGLGRNCTLFDKTSLWAYSAIRQEWPDYRQWLDSVIQRVEVNNLAFPVQLPPQECIAIARSVAKWTYQHFTAASFAQHVADTHTPEIQAVRGRKGGKKNCTEVQAEKGRKSKRGAVPDSERTQKPWEALGISQRTYYRKKRKTSPANNNIPVACGSR